MRNKLVKEKNHWSTITPSKSVPPENTSNSPYDVIMTAPNLRILPIHMKFYGLSEYTVKTQISAAFQMTNLGKSGRILGFFHGSRDYAFKMRDFHSEAGIAFLDGFVLFYIRK